MEDNELEKAHNRIEELVNDLADEQRRSDNVSRHLEVALMKILATGNQSHEKSEQFVDAAREVCGGGSVSDYIASLKTKARQQGYYGNS